jgi:hypothetical protein
MDFDTVAAVMDGLFGDAVDPRVTWDQISKMNPDASDVHVNRALKAKKEKRQAQIGLASNVVGLAAGGAALVAAARNPALKRAVPASYKGGPITARAGKYLKTDAGRARLYRAGATGALGLQAVNTGGDVVANRVLNREAKKEVKKALDDIVDARKRGIISTETAIQMSAELVEKFDKTGFKEINEHAEALVDHPLLPKKAKIGLKALNTTKTTTQKATKKVKQAAAPIVKAETPELTWTGEIAKFDTDKRQVFGWCSITAINGEPVVDLQGDYVPLEEIEKAAYTYVVDSRKGGDMHKRDGESPLHTSDLVESFVVTPEKLVKMGLPSDALPHGWWVGFKVNDDTQWEMVKNGERTGFSIHGAGRRVEKMLGD